MPQLAETSEQERREQIRQYLVQNPGATNYRITKYFGWDKEYVKKLAEEVRQERINNIRSQTKDEVAAQMEDLVQYVNKMLLQIVNEELSVEGSVNSMRVAQANRIKALNSIIENSEKLLNMKMDLGVLERQLGTMEVNEGVKEAFYELKRIREGEYTDSSGDGEAGKGD